MIRFVPDIWSDAVLRPLMMALPNAGIYVEFMAPDLRFSIIVLLGLAMLLLRGGEHSRAANGTLKVTVFFFVVAFAVWLATSGNGRYFIPILLLAGPLLVALANRVRAGRSFRAAIVGVALVLQAGALVSVSPWGWWGLAQWRDGPFYPVELDEVARTQPATYVLITPMSRSLIAHHFPQEARWVNLVTLGGVLAESPSSQRLTALLGGSESLLLLVPTRPDYMDSFRMPSEALVEALDNRLANHGLSFSKPAQCRLLESAGLVSEITPDPALLPQRLQNKVGFWVCALSYSATAVRSVPESLVDDRVRQAFAAVENQCPRFFPAGQRNATRIEGGWRRSYPNSDLRLQVYDSGVIYYRYWRAINPGYVGTVDEALREPSRLRCNAIKERSGLPWARGV